MSMKIVAMLVAVLLITACAAPVATATPAWTPEESAYMAALLAPLDEMTRQMNGLSPTGKRSSGAEILSQLSHLPDTPASLAPIDYYRAQLVYSCGDELARDFDGCRSSNNTLNLELARLYATRGSYPPAP